jgi:hypothetical protein
MFVSRSSTRLIVLASLLVSLSLVATTSQAQPAPATPAATQPAATPADGTAPPVAAPAPTDPAATATPPIPAEEPPGIRLRKLEQRVQELKEQAWRIKARVAMLKEAVLGGGIGARATITHEHKMGGSFRLIKIVYALDGQQIYSRTDDSGKLDEQKRIEILSGPIAPGTHTLAVMVTYQGWGFGVFEYLRNYKFNIRSSHTFTVGEGKATSITVVGYEQGGATTPMEKRPKLDFKVSLVSEASAPAAAK